MHSWTENITYLVAVRQTRYVISYRNQDVGCETDLNLYRLNSWLRFVPLIFHFVE